MVYLERKVLDGRIGLSRHRSVVYYNPLALYPLPSGVFPSLNQSWLQLASLDLTVTDHWVWL